MYQLIKLHAGRTYTAGIRFTPVGATDIACVCNGQWYFSHSFRAANELGVRDASFIHLLNKPLLDFFLSDYVSEKHINK